MATTETLNIIANMLQLNQASKESDKNRGLEIAKMKLQSDEAELDRIDRRMAIAEKNLMDLTKEFTTMTGIERDINDLQGESNLSSDAKSIVGQGKGRLVDDIMAGKERIKSLQDQALEIIGDMGDYTKAWNLSPTVLDKYRRKYSSAGLFQQATIGDKEWTEIQKEFSGKGDVFLAGLRSGVSKYGEDRIKQLLNLRAIQQREAAAAARAGGAQLNAFTKEIVNNYKQWRDYALGMTERLDNPEEHGAIIGDIPTSSTDLHNSITGLANQITQKAIQGKDKDNFWFFQGETPEDMKKLMADYEKAGTQGEKDTIALQLTNQLLMTPGGPGEVLDYKTFGGEDRKRNAYLAHLLQGFEILQQWKNLDIQLRGGSPLVGAAATSIYDRMKGSGNEALSIQDSVQTDTSSSDSGGSFRDFWYGLGGMHQDSTKQDPYNRGTSEQRARFKETLISPVNEFGEMLIEGSASLLPKSSVLDDTSRKYTTTPDELINLYLHNKLTENDLPPGGIEGPLYKPAKMTVDQFDEFMRLIGIDSSYNKK